MTKNSTQGFQHKILFTIIIIIALCWPFHGYTSQNQERSDLIRIQLADSPKARQMPEVIFLHDRHTEAIEKPSCKTCHLEKENNFVFKFKRLADTGYKPDMKLYHEQCTGCHKDGRDKGLTAGPRTGECRKCHSKTLPYVDTAQPFGMDKSLHYRHVIADVIRPVGIETDGNCSACHHEYDKALKKTIYVQGKEGTCRYCHKQEKIAEARPLKAVVHEVCLNCHYKLNANEKNSGPTNCAACHESARQSSIAKLEKIPRIQRNQPDVVLLSTWLKEALESKKPSNQFVEPVAFDHLSHEKQVKNCRSCHHESMEPCTVCHTKAGTEKSKFVSLEQAMHSSDAFNSCIGCHRKSMKSADCAGCHAQMNAKQVDEIKCNYCHRVLRKSLKPLPENDEATARIAAMEINVRSSLRPVIANEQIPKKVTIDIMMDQYGSVTFPHRQIVKSLIKRIQNSMLAQYFHGQPTSLCLGCHHHSPSAITYPKCAGCHGTSLKTKQNGKLGLKGAYHGQCSTCHQHMGLEKPVSTDCTACHQKKTTMVQPTALN